MVDLVSTAWVEEQAAATLGDGAEIKLTPVGSVAQLEIAPGVAVEVFDLHGDLAAGFECVGVAAAVLAKGSTAFPEPGMLAH